MRGSIVKRRWKGRISFSAVIDVAPDPTTGKRRQRWTTFQTRREAEAHLVQALSQAGSGGSGSARVLVSAFLEQWLRDEVARLEPSTRRTYEYDVRHYLVPEIGHLPLRRLSAQVIQGCLTRMLGRRLRPSTVHQSYRVLRTAMAAAVRWGYLPKDPCSLVKPPRAEHADTTIWDEEQTRLFLGEAQRSSRYYPFYLTLLLSGLRPGEALALAWPDVDLTFACITARRKLYRIGREQVWGDIKTHRNYTVSIPPVLVEELRRLRERQARERLIQGQAHTDSQLVFCQPNGKPLHLHNVGQRDFKAVVKRAGLPQIRLYDLRHCHATHLARQGAPITVTQSQLGHRNSSTTLRYYVHPMPDLQHEHVGRLAERLMGRRDDTDGGSGSAR